MTIEARYPVMTVRRLRWNSACYARAMRRKISQSFKGSLPRSNVDVAMAANFANGTPDRERSGRRPNAGPPTSPTQTALDPTRRNSQRSYSWDYSRAVVLRIGTVEAIGCVTEPAMRSGAGHCLFSLAANATGVASPKAECGLSRS